MRLGLLGARADLGGLAAMTREFHRHLHPERTLLVDFGSRGRGPAHHDWYDGQVTVVHGTDDHIPPDTVERFLDGLDAVWAAETPYRADVFDRARRLGVRSYLHVMPELWRADYAPPDVVLLPTSWEADRLPAGRVLPWPVARDRLPFRRREQCRTLVHVAAPAMLDRNGTRLVLAAMRYVTWPCTLDVRGWPARLPRRIGRVTIRQSSTSRENYWEAWPDDGDVLLLPRRYAGLSLPMAEAGSLGMPVVSLDLPPQREWLPADTLVPVTGSRPARMAGGTFPVATADPRALARVVNRLIADPELVGRCSDAADAHARSISWDTLLPVYRDTFAGL